MTSADGARRDGLQPERTGQAWERTALAFLGLGLAVPRLAWPVLGPWALAFAIAVVGGAVALFLAGRHRLSRTPGSVHPDGWLPLLATLVALVLAVVGLVLVVVGHAG